MTPSQCQGVVDDGILVKRIATGCRDSYHTLYSRYIDAIYRYCLCKVGTDDVMDTVQEALIAVWKGANKYSGLSSVRSWIFGIVHKKCMDTLRIKVGTKGRVSSIEEVELPADYRNSDAEISSVRDALKQLCEELREPVFLVYYLGFKYDEVSVVLDIPVGTVKSRMHSARHILAELLKEA